MKINRIPLFGTVTSQKIVVNVPVAANVWVHILPELLYRVFMTYILRTVIDEDIVPDHRIRWLVPPTRITSSRAPVEIAALWQAIRPRIGIRYATHTTILEQSVHIRVRRPE